MSDVNLKPVTVAEMAARFGKSTRWSAATMRKMRHVPGTARSMFTTEEWLAEWLAAESVPQRNWPKRNLDPLEEAVCSRVIEVIGDLTRIGKIRVVSV